MFKKETEYALRSLVYIQKQNEEGNMPGITETASAIDAPQHFTAKILQRMVRLGYIKSVKGKNGGYFFDPDQQDLILKKIVVALEGDKIFTACGFGLKQCDDANPCPLHDDYASIRDALDRLLSKETIQSMAKKDSLNV